MPRALCIVTGVRAGPRAEILAGFRATRQRAAAASCNYWVFEDGRDPASWTEFFEARDDETLRDALRQMQPPVPPDSLLREVELG